MPAARSIPTAALLCGIAVLALIACGGSSDEDQIRDVIEQGLVESDPSNCEELVTQNYIDKAFAGSVEACKTDAQQGDRAESVEIANVEVSGDSASAEATPMGGGSDGQAISLKLVKDDGDWKVDDAAVGGGANQFIDLFLQTVRQDAIAKGLSGEVADCIIEELRGSLTPAELEALAAGESPPSARKKSAAAGSTCAPAAPGK